MRSFAEISFSITRIGEMPKDFSLKNAIDGRHYRRQFCNTIVESNLRNKDDLAAVLLTGYALFRCPESHIIANLKLFIIDIIFI